jgi:Protein of unknown function (DUF1579)
MNPSRALLCVAVVAIFSGSSAMAQPAAKPTAEHKILTADEGTWDATVKAFSPDSTAEPTVTKGTEVNTLFAGGLWILSKFEGEFAGAKFEGHGQFGYDPIKKKYVGTWIDSMSPMLSVLEGTYDATTKTMTYVGDGIDPSSNTKYSQKMVTTTKDDGSRVFTLFMKFEGSKDETKVMEVTYQKRK